MRRPLRFSRPNRKIASSSVRIAGFKESPCRPEKNQSEAARSSSLSRAGDAARKGRQRGSGSVSDHMTHQELATSSKAFGVQGLLPGSRQTVHEEPILAL